MEPDDHGNHGGHQPPQPQTPKPLLEDATATIYLDGLIYAGYNKDAKLFEGGILTAAEEHHVVVDVTLKDKNGKKIPVWHLEASHEIVKAQAPFWVYVDSGEGLQKREFSAELYREGPQSIVNILSFEKLHERELPPKPETFAVVNFPHGITYSAETKEVKLKSLAQGAMPAQAQFVRNMPVATLTAVDINAFSNGTGSKFVVLASKDGNHELLRLELQQGQHYEIQILNQPVNPHAGHDPREHFLQFYELFVLNPDEKMFLVEPPIASVAVPQGTPGSAPSPPHTPPCVTTFGNTEGGLGGG